MNRCQKIMRVGLIVISLVYIAVLLKIVLFKSGIDSSEFRYVQYIPFTFVMDFFDSKASITALLKNVLGNFAIFIPLGILLPFFFQKLTLWKTAVVGLTVSFGFEIIQYLTGFGMTDIDDLILNTLGTFVGAALYIGLFKKLKTQCHIEVAVFSFLVIFGCCGVLSLWLYSPSMLMIPDQIEYVNNEILGDVDEQSYDLSAECLKIEGGVIYLEETSVEASENSKAQISTQYALADGALLIIRDKIFQYSPSGSIQKQTIAYSIASEDDINFALMSEYHCFHEKLWIDDNGECYMMILTLQEN
ncbi:MAG: VanZ family protein [Eubacteriales bacterium]|nr:VanZ family protein [Eubacteriales bacterium]MDY4971486.1 VanZ family protein [Lachnospiraceae bacterium]